MSLAQLHRDFRPTIFALRKMRVLNTMAMLGGRNSRHSEEMTGMVAEQEPPQLQENAEAYWRARRDSNSRPIAPEAIALSS